MSATELVELLEQAQHEGLGDEPLQVTAEQAEHLQSLLEWQSAVVHMATSIPTDGRLLRVRG